MSYFRYFLIFLSTLGYSQQNDLVNFYKIEYLKTFTFEHLPQPLNSNYTLDVLTDLNKSIFYKKEDDKTPQIKEDVTPDGNVNLTYTPSGKNWGVVYKNYRKNEMFFKYDNRRVVVDSLSIFNWQIKEETKELLGFNCQKATMDYRGRTYIAWFTSDLPSGGPWKYDGLSGMILEIKSTDNYIKFMALSVSGSSNNKNLKNPFSSNNRFMSWQDYKDFYKQRAISAFNYKPTESSRGFEYSRGGIEVYIDYDDEEYNDKLKKYRKNRF